MCMLALEKEIQTRVGKTCQKESLMALKNEIELKVAQNCAKMKSAARKSKKSKPKRMIVKKIGCFC